MNTAQQNLQNEWSINVLAQKEVGFSIFLVLRFVIYNVSQLGLDILNVKRQYKAITDSQSLLAQSDYRLTFITIGPQQLAAIGQ